MNLKNLCISIIAVATLATGFLSNVQAARPSHDEVSTYLDIVTKFRNKYPDEISALYILDTADFMSSDIQNVEKMRAYLELLKTGIDHPEQFRASLQANAANYQQSVQDFVDEEKKEEREGDWISDRFNRFTFQARFSAWLLGTAIVTAATAIECSPDYSCPESGFNVASGNAFCYGSDFNATSQSVSAIPSERNYPKSTSGCIASGTVLTAWNLFWATYAVGLYKQYTNHSKNLTAIRAVRLRLEEETTSQLRAIETETGIPHLGKLIITLVKNIPVVVAAE